MFDLFVSHATHDDSQADALAKALSNHHLTTWIDHQGGLQPGAPNWDRAIREAVQTCKAGVLLMSPRSLASDICAAECLLLRELGKPLYVAYLETCSSGDIWLYVKMVQYADLRADFEGGAAKLAHALRGETSADAPTPVLGKITGADVMRGNLPYLNTVPLIGREADLERIRGKLGPHVTQLIAVGGAGKSRMAAEIALNHPTGAVWHRCDSLSESYQVVDLLRKHYGLDEKASETTILDSLGGTPPLVVLDNAEDIPPSTPRRSAYADVMGRLTARGTPILLTSRATWDELKPRREDKPEPLNSPAAAKVALGFAEAEAIQLTETEAAELAEAARLHPRLMEFAVRQLHERELSRVLRLLRELKHGDIQEALDEMIRKTVRQMAEQAKGGPEAERLLRRITVFRGPFDGAALDALKPDGIDEDGLDDAQGVLQRWGFLRKDVGGRWRLDDLAAAALPPDAEAQERHFAHYRGLHGDYDANSDEDRHPLIEADWPNIRAALAWGLEARPGEAVGWVYALHYFMGLRISRAEHGALVQTAHQAAEQAGDTRLQATTLEAMGDVAYMQNDYAAAGERYGRALALFEAVGSRLGQANTLRAMGDVARMQNEYEVAGQRYGWALALYEAVGSRLGQANMLKAMGDVAYMEDDYEAAGERYGRALALFEVVGDRLGQANTLQAMGEVAYMEDDYEAAGERYGWALALYKAVGSRLGQANTLKAMGDVARMQDDYEAAGERYGRALPLYEAVGDRLGQANTLKAMGEVAYMQDEYEAAREHYGRALPLYEAVGSRLGQANTLRAMGDGGADTERV
jgi:tetratricopeptide (TPR) repeat protein